MLLALVGTFVLGGGASTTAAAAVQSASAQTGAAHLLPEYLAAWPAGIKLSKVEAAL